MTELKFKLIVKCVFQLHFSVEAIRATEILFQPSMMGIVEAGVAETIDYVLKLFSAEDQQRLVDNIFLTGGKFELTIFDRNFDGFSRCQDHRKSLA